MLSFSLSRGFFIGLPLTACLHTIVICVDLFFNACDPSINDILIGSPDLSDPNCWDISLGGVFADGDFMEIEIFRHFLFGHDLGQNRISRRKAFFIRKGMGSCFFLNTHNLDLNQHKRNEKPTSERIDHVTSDISQVLSPADTLRDWIDIRG